METLKGKIALVTGGSRGIGAAVALSLAGAGADVAVNFQARAEDAEKVCLAIRNLGRRALAIQANVSQSDQVKKMVAQIESKLGAVNIVVNNAGIARQLKLEDIAESDWEEHISVNLKSAFLVTQAVLPQMRAQRWGRIINISSTAAQTGGLVGPHYAASKAGMLGLTHSYAALLATEGITANTVCLALVETDMLRANPRATSSVIPIGRFGNVDEVASVISREVRDTDLIGKIDTGTISLVLLDADFDSSTRVIDRLVARIDHYDFPTPLRISVGAACYPTHAVDADSLKRQAISRPVVSWRGGTPPRVSTSRN